MSVTVGDDAEVFVPARPRFDTADTAASVQIEMRSHEDGTPVAVCFRTLRALVDALGDFQPWVCMHMSHFRLLVLEADVTDVQIDPQPEVEMSRWMVAQRWTEAGLLAYTAKVENGRGEG